MKSSPSFFSGLRSPRASISALAFAAFSVMPVAGAFAANESGYDWMPPEAESASLASADTANMAREVTITKTPKPTADISKFTNIYTLELEKFGIKNDGTDADATSKGINEALQHAKTVGANRIVFPKGTYLISEKAPVNLDHHDTIIDLNGATLKMRPNGQPHSSVIDILPGAKNLRLTNGTVYGDRDEHDYSAAPGEHEGGHCVRVIGGHNLEIDHLHLTKAAGDGLNASATGARNRDELLARIHYNVNEGHLESGGFNEKGEKTDNAEKIRSIKPFEVGGTKLPRFELGYLSGYQGFPWIKSRAYQVYFFDENESFIEMRRTAQYRKEEVPANAKYMHVEFNQPGIDEEAAHSGASKEWLVRINNFTFSTDVHVHNNLITENRRLGMTDAGQQWLVEHNRFERNGGTAPSYGIDLEDGWEMMQNVVIRKNTFKDNVVGDLVVCAGSEIVVEDNVFEKSVVFHGRSYNYFVRGNEFNGAVNYSTRSGIATIGGNTYRNNRHITVRFDNKGVADGFYRKAGENVSTPALLLRNENIEGAANITGTYINFEGSTIRNSKFNITEETTLVRIKDSTLDDNTLNVQPKGGSVVLQLSGNNGELTPTGPGVGRIEEK